MRILHILPSWEIGGAETLVLHLTRELASRGHDVSVLTWRQRGPLEREFGAAGIRTFNLGAGGRFGIVDAARCFRIVRAGGFDVIHAHLFPINYWVALFPGNIGRRVYTEHSTSNRRRGPGALRGALRWVERVVYGRYDAVVAVSEAVRRSLDGWLAARRGVDCVRNGVPVGCGAARALGAVGQGWNRLLFVGRLTRAKGVDVLIGALGELRARGRILTLDVVGDGEERRELQALAGVVGVSGQITFHGVRRDLERFYDGRPVVVLPSRWEGLPMALLEAMRAGCPIVATRAGGMPEALLEGEAGVLCEKGSSKALAAAVERLSGDGALAEELGRRARERFLAEYTIEQTAGRYLEIYDGSLAR